MSAQATFADTVMHPDDCVYCERAWREQQEKREYEEQVAKRIKAEMNHYRRQLIGLHAYLIKQLEGRPYIYNWGYYERARKMGTIGLKYLALKDRLEAM